MDDDDLTGCPACHEIIDMSEEGPGLRFVRSQGCPVWTAMGLVRSALNRIELEDQRRMGRRRGLSDAHPPR